ncbi:hypothetical protein [Nonomuraea basaltis]|uniref:hypothetical protein n=1 Tax=Nonomuraea basaltis TaxID=2495887 RepID=UPI00110C62C9|nr:hypothetical protein [Nonomuraea basaltis]TMR96914.1 hypothetical protein EJK15_20980 [Nonomuraea basaltis]
MEEHFVPSIITRATIPHWHRLEPRTIMAMIAVMAGIAAGVLATVAMTDAISAYHTTHRQVVAQVVEEGSIVAEVSWKDETGMQRSGRVRAPLDHISDTRARIWLDAQGRSAPRPFGPVEAVFCFLLAGASAGGVTWLALWRARLVGHW